MLYLLLIRCVSSIDPPETGVCGDATYQYFTSNKELDFNIGDNPSSAKEVSCDTFQGRDDIISVIVNSDIEKIGDHLFSGCTSLERVTFPSPPYSLKDIGEYAFEDCINLYSVRGSVSNKVGSYAFKGCTALESIGFLCVEYGDYVFQDCVNLGAFTFNDEVKIIGSNLFDGCNNVVVNNIENCRQLTKIGSNLFKLSNEYVEIFIPDSVTEVERPLFNSCPKLQHVHLPISATTGTGDFFENCPYLTELTFKGESNIEIDKQVIGSFQELVTLTTINIEPQNVTFGPNAFKDCINLESIIYVNEGARRAQWNFGTYSFYGCKKLESISVYKVIDDYAFCKCTSLTTVESATSQYDLKKGGKYIFSECSNLQSLNILFSELGDYAFAKCTFSQFTIPSAGTYGHSLFGECQNLNRLDVVSATIDNDAIFADIPNTFSLYVTGQSCQIHIPTEITIHMMLDSVNVHQFENCTGATFVFENPDFFYVGDYGLAHCKKVNEDTLSRLLTKSNGQLGEGALMDTGITNLYFVNPYMLIDRGAWSLAYCENLKTIKCTAVADAYTKIGIPAYCFYGSGIEELVFDHITTIEEYAFSNCPNLASITINNDVTVGEYAFSDNPSLSFLGYYSSSEPNFEENALENCPKLEAVEVGNDYNYDNFLGLPLSNPKPKDPGSSSNAGLIAGVVIAVIIVLGVGGFCFYYFYYKKNPCPFQFPFFNNKNQNAEVEDFENVDEKNNIKTDNEFVTDVEP